MKDNISIIFATIVGTFLIVLLPLYSILDRQDSMSYNVVLNETTKFVDGIRNNGFIDRETYLNYISSLASTANSYKVVIEAYKKILIHDTDKDGNIIEDSYTEEMELYNTKDILEILENQTTIDSSNSNKTQNVYLFNKNDEIYVKVYNTNITTGSIIYKMIAGVEQDKIVDITYGGTINNINWDLYNKVSEKATIYPQIALTVPVNAIGSDNIIHNTETTYLTGNNYIYLYDLTDSNNKTIKTSAELIRIDEVNVGIKDNDGFMALEDINESNFRNYKEYIINNFIQLNGMYADIDIALSENENYFLDITLTNVRMSTLNYISNLASITILPGFGKDSSDNLSLGAETVQLELQNATEVNTITISNPINFKQMLKTNVIEATITDGYVYKDQEIAFIISYTGINQEDSVVKDAIQSTLTSSKVLPSQITLYTMDEFITRYGSSPVANILTDITKHMIVMGKYNQPTRTGSARYKTDIYLPEGWIETNIDFVDPDTGDIIKNVAEGVNSREFEVLIDDVSPINPVIILDGKLGNKVTGTQNDYWYTSDVKVSIIESKDQIKLKELNETAIDENAITIGGSGVDTSYIKIGTSAERVYDGYIKLTNSTKKTAITAYSKDYVGNYSQKTTTNVYIDKEKPTAPQINVEGTKVSVNAQWYISKDIKILVKSGQDTISGVKETTLEITGANKVSERVISTNSQLAYKLNNDGVSNIIVRTYDNAGNCSEITKQVKVDTSKPAEAKFQILSGKRVGSWYNTSVKVRIFVENVAAGPTYTVVGQEQGKVIGPITFTNTYADVELTASDKYQIIVNTKTAAGYSNDTVFNVNIDMLAPNMPILKITGNMGKNGWYTSDVTVLAPKVGDNGLSGEQESISYILNNQNTVINRANKINIPEGINNLKIISTDYAGNQIVGQDTQIKVDKTKPTVDLVIRGTQGLNGWYIGEKVDISYENAWDEVSKVENVMLSHNKINTPTKETKVSVTVTDNAGNSITKEKTIKFDNRPPTAPKISIPDTDLPVMLGFQFYNRPVEVKIQGGVDNISKATTTYKIIKNGSDRGERNYTGPFTLSDDGKYIVYAYTYDDAGNKRESSVTFMINTQKPVPPELISINGEKLNDISQTVEGYTKDIIVQLDKVEEGNTINVILQKQLEQEHSEDRPITKVIQTVVTDSKIVVAVPEYGTWQITLTQTNKYYNTSQNNSGLYYYTYKLYDIPNPDEEQIEDYYESDNTYEINE